jgi:hypothetical protein
LLVSLTEGSPFYISSVIRSDCSGKDLTTIDGLTRTLEFETLDDLNLEMTDEELEKKLKAPERLFDYRRGKKSGSEEIF